MAVRILAIVLLVVSGVWSGEAVRFHLGAGTRRCFTDDLPMSRKIQGEVQVANGKGAAEIDVKISTLAGQVLYQHRGHDHGKFTFSTPMHRENYAYIEEEEYYDPEDYDTYSLCIEHVRLGGGAEDIQGRLVSFTWKAEDLELSRGSRVKKDTTDTLQLAMNDMRATLKDLSSQLSTLQQRERSLVKKSEKANSVVIFYAACAIFVAFGVSAFQMKYFQRYFKSKKIL